MTIQLYSMAYQDRSDRVRWLLEEMNIPYQNNFLKKGNGELNTPEYKKINPMGRVPSIIDGPIHMFESAAICLYLADKYSYGLLAPTKENEQLRADYLKWMVFSVGSLECVVARMFTHMNSPEEEKTTREFVKKESANLSLALTPLLEKQDYILSSGFSAADIMLGSIIPGAHDYLVLGNPSLEAYMERLMKREAAIRAKVF
ncbi:MAG: glutathione S-transferase family protein [Bacteriovorax sp.]|nr:glutathione S-transferase family protein [Bacteriovorax sp.]